MVKFHFLLLLNSLMRIMPFLCITVKNSIVLVLSIDLPEITQMSTWYPFHFTHQVVFPNDVYLTLCLWAFLQGFIEYVGDVLANFLLEIVVPGPFTILEESITFGDFVGLFPEYFTIMKVTMHQS